MNLDIKSLEPMTELIGIGLGKAAEVLNTMLNSHVRLSVPSMRIIEPGDLASALAPRGDESLSAVEMDFSGDLAGCAELVFASVDAGRLVDCITADVPILGEDLDSIRAGTLCEVGNIVINAILGTIVNVVKANLSYSVPIYLHGRPKDLLTGAASGAGVIILVTTRFQIESIEVDGDILLFLSISTFASLERALGRFVNG
ncbi:MAG: chemotaxis protein CheC [Spirochaetota bacterium]